MYMYKAQFIGRTKGAIGIFYRIETTIAADNQEHARELLYNGYEHIAALHLEQIGVQRFVLTYVNKDGMRTLMQAAQGRHTHETAEQAQRALDAILGNNSADMLKSVWGPNPQYEVRPCECWPDHYDPISIYFD